MSTFGTNILQAVQTYQPSSLGILQNLFCGINTFNKRFVDFNSLTANLGSTVTYDLPPRMISQDGLVVTNFIGVEQRVRSLTVGGTDAQGNQQAANVPFGFTAEQLIFNIDNNDYRKKIELPAMVELGSRIERSVLSTILTGAYRFATGLTSFQSLDTAIVNLQDYGSVNYNLRGYLPAVSIPQIVGSGLTQFVMDRNEQLAYDWELGRFASCDWYKSNLLPTHIAGTVGQEQQTLTVVSIDPTGTILTCSGATASDPDAIVANDLLQFQDGVGGQPNIRFLTFSGHAPSQQPVQIRAVTGSAATGGGQVTFTIDPPLISDPTSVNYNITVPIAAGMQLLALDSHRRGLLTSGDSCFLGMPMLPDQYPFPTANKVDEDSGAAIRFTYGAQFGGNFTGFIYDSIWGSDIAPDYNMALIFPM